MDLVRAEPISPVLIRGPRRDAQRRALAGVVTGHQRPGHGLAARLGAALATAGCRLESAGRRFAAMAPGAELAPRGCGA